MSMRSRGRGHSGLFKTLIWPLFHAFVELLSRQLWDELGVGGKQQL
jgi:hypothetical protein